MNPKPHTKPLFLPLKREYYNAIVSGLKTFEYRMGKRWNARTCPVGRPVTLSLGYGKQNRSNATITSFRMVKPTALNNQERKDIHACYGDVDEIAQIGITVEPA